MIAHQVQGKALRVLAVDDEPALCKVVARLLGVEGHTVVVAYSAEDAIASLVQATFDLIIADLGLGPASLNGWDLAEHVKRSYPATRFVLATGWGPQISPAEARARGVEKVISKPYKLSELRDIVLAAQ